MDDYISRQAAIDALNGEIEITGRNNANAVLKYTKKITDNIKALPSADVQPVVRCKDCKWFEKNVCNKFSNNYEPLVYVSPYDFCSRGERKDGEQNGTD